jgi:hypothetical protein
MGFVCAAGGGFNDDKLPKAIIVHPEPMDFTPPPPRVPDVVQVKLLTIVLCTTLAVLAGCKGKDAVVAFQKLEEQD